MKYWQKKIKCCIAILASLFMIEQGIDGNEENHLVFGYQAEENKGISYEKETEKIQMKQEYIEVEWGKVYQLEENGTEILFEEQAGNIVIYETRETEKRKIKEEKMNSPLWLYDIDQDGCLEVLTNKKEIEGTFYDWDKEKHQFRKAYQKYLSEPEKEQELVFINKNTEEQVSGIEGATYYELSVYDKKEQGGLLQNIRYPFVEDEWSVFNNFSFLDVNFDEYTDLSITKSSIYNCLHSFHCPSINLYNSSSLHPVPNGSCINIHSFSSFISYKYTAFSYGFSKILPPNVFSNCFFSGFQ